MKRKSVVIVGFGNIGHYAYESVTAEKDMELKGIVETAPNMPDNVDGIPIVSDVSSLEKPDVAILCVPSRLVKKIVPLYLEKGICTVDPYDIHGETMLELRKEFDDIGKKNNAASIIAAGWDPGSDSMIRGIMKLMVPRGVTHTNFGPGMSMGHSVVAKAVEGVEDAVSLTIPVGTGLHRRLVYVKLKPGADLEKVEAQIKQDNYFRNDETYVYAIDDIEDVKDMGHGVHIEHKGKAGITHNQIIDYVHHINNPAVTAQVLTSAARAVTKQKPGCYTLLEVPIADYLNMDLETLVRKMV